MFGMSLAEITIIVIVILVVLGPEKIPEVARTAGKTMREIRRAGNMLRDAIMLEDDKRNRPKYTPPKPSPAFAAADETPHAPSIEHDWDDGHYGSAHHHDDWHAHHAATHDVPLHAKRETREGEEREVALPGAKGTDEETDGHPSTRAVFIHGRVEVGS